MIPAMNRQQRRMMEKQQASAENAPVAGEARPVAYCVPAAGGKVMFGKGWMFSPVPVGDAQMPLYAAPQASEAVRDALQKLVDMYVLNQGSDHEHITCYTPLPASHLTPKQRAKSETWKAWDDARAALSAQPGAQRTGGSDARERLHSFLDAAAGEGVSFAGVNADQLYIDLFPERYAAAVAQSPVRRDS